MQDVKRDLLGEERGAGTLAEHDDALARGEAWAPDEDGAPVDADAPLGDEAGELDAEPARGEQGVEPDPRLVHLDAEGRPKIIEVRFVVEEDFHGLRVDHYLKRKIPRLSRTRIQDIIRTQLVGPGGRRLKPHSPVQTGDRLVIHRPARPEPPAPRTFGVLHEDDAVLVVDKPALLAMHATARYYFNTLTRLLFERFPGQGLQIAHRLDRETSGCVVVAKGREVASRLKGAFEGRRVAKTYLAVVVGEPAWDEQVVELPLRLSPSSRLKIRMEVHEGGLSAITHVRVVERRRGATLVACKPVTGRQHQIRAHLAALGNPIVGDKLYLGGDEAFARYAEREVPDEEIARDLGLPRQALHAASITFPHPTTGAPLTVESPLPPDIAAFLAAR